MTETQFYCMMRSELKKYHKVSQVAFMYVVIHVISEDHDDNNESYVHESDEFHVSRNEHTDDDEDTGGISIKDNVTGGSRGRKGQGRGRERECSQESGKLVKEEEKVEEEEALVYQKEDVKKRIVFGTLNELLTMGQLKYHLLKMYLVLLMKQRM